MLPPVEPKSPHLVHDGVGIEVDPTGELSVRSVSARISAEAVFSAKRRFFCFKYVLKHTPGASRGISKALLLLLYYPESAWDGHPNIRRKL